MAKSGKCVGFGTLLQRKPAIASPTASEFGRQNCQNAIVTSDASYRPPHLDTGRGYDNEPEELFEADQSSKSSIVVPIFWYQSLNLNEWMENMIYEVTEVNDSLFRNRSLTAKL
jgi:hypothetical protein